MSSRLLVDAGEGGALRLKWFGDLTVEAVKEGIGEIQALDAGHAWVDLLAVTSCPLEVRPLLVEFHLALMGRTRRRVWIAASPKLRAMGTWIAHMAEDSAIRIVATTKQGDSWLGSTEERLAPAKRGIEAYLEWKAAK